MSKLIAAILGVIAVSSVYSAHSWWNDTQTNSQTPVSQIEASAANLAAADAVESGTGPQVLLERLESLEQSLVTVKQSLRSEQASTLALQRELLKLSDKIDEQNSATDTLSNDNELALSVRSSPELSAGLQKDAEAAHAASNRFQDLTNPLEPTAANLVAAGVDPDTAEDIQRRLDEYTLAELEVRDTAAREGWLQSAEFRTRQEALLPPEVDLKTELGEQGWDQFLYLQGRNNRVRVESVINGSAAAGAGIVTGDLLLVYASERIYTVGELQSATRDGQRGEVVTVRLDRQGSLLDTTIERGPLGVMLAAERVSPDNSTLNP